MWDTCPRDAAFAMETVDLILDRAEFETVNAEVDTDVESWALCGQDALMALTFAQTLAGHSSNDSPELLSALKAQGR